VRCSSSNPIKTKVQCEAAAGALGMEVTKAVEATMESGAQLPPGCSYANSKLYFNPDSSSTAPCHEAHRCPCVNDSCSTPSKFKEECCSMCSAGHYSASSGATECAPCAAGKFSAGSAPCAVCPKGQSAVGEVKDVRGSTDCLACRDPEWCAGGGSVGTCIPSRKGTGCTTCITGYALFQGSCIACPDQPWVTALPLVFASVFVVYMLRKLRGVGEDGLAQLLVPLAMEGKTDRDNEGSAGNIRSAAQGANALVQQVAGLMSVLAFAQMSTTLIQNDFGWPLDVRWFSGILNAIVKFELASGQAAPDCVPGMQMSDSARWAVLIAVPLVPLLILGGLILCLGACRRTALLPASVPSGVLSYFLVTMVALATAATSPWDCVTYGPLNLMRDSPDVTCDMAGAKPDQDSSSKSYSATLKSAAKPAAPQGIAASGVTLATLELTYAERVTIGTVTLVFCIGAIAILGIVLFLRRNTLRSDKYLMKACGSLYMRYEPKYYYWEIVMLLRKLMLVLITRLLTGQQTAQITACAVVLGGALVLQHFCKPALSDALDTLEEHTLMACTAIVALGAASASGLLPLAVSVLYFFIMAASTVLLWRDLRAVWLEKDPTSSAPSVSVIVAGAGVKENPLGLGTETLELTQMVGRKGDKKEQSTGPVTI
jgi:hypothetical protein